MQISNANAPREGEAPHTTAMHVTSEYDPECEPQLVPLKNPEERPRSMCRRMSSIDSLATIRKLFLERGRSDDSTDNLLDELMIEFNNEEEPFETHLGRKHSGGLNNKKRQRESFTAWALHGNMGSILDDTNYEAIFQSMRETDSWHKGHVDYWQEAAPKSHTPGNDGTSSKETKEMMQGDDSTTCNYFTDVDVLLGRGGLVNIHPGNQAYLRRKERLQNRYLTATKDEKTEISQELVDWIHACGGRFLQRSDHDKTCWHEVDNTRARKKASQTLREVNTPETRAYKRIKYSGQKGNI
jgi:hypothetical protein